MGREAELAALASVIARGERLVTILGTGGIGKTRLAVEIAKAHPNARICDLSEATSVEAACASFGRTLDVPIARGGAEVSVDELGRSLASQGEVLVVLDNFEQLVAHGPALLGRWCALAPEATFVVTSRTRLELPNETCFPLMPLPEADAVRLFVERARSARADFVLAEADAPAAAEVVRTLDGLPLAIELAAVRVGMLGVAQLLELLPRQLDALGRGPRTAPARHATLRSAIDWSWNALGDDDQQALAACSVFRGGFRLEAAEDVLGAYALDRLQSLHDRSLVFSYAPGGDQAERRYALYESVRAYAAERLAASGREPETLARHAAAYLARYGPTNSMPEGVWRRRLLLDRENVEAIHERRTTPSDAVLALLTLAPVYFTRGPLDRFERLLRQALDALGEADAGLAARGGAHHGWVLHLLGRHAEAVRVLEAASALASPADDLATWALARGKLACAFAFLDDVPQARATVAEAEELLAREASAPERRGAALPVRVRAQFHRDRASTLIREGRAAEGRAALEAALPLFRDAGARRDEGIVRFDLAGADIEVGDLVRAAEHVDVALAIFAEIGDQRLEAGITTYAGIVALLRDDLDEARRHLERSRGMLLAFGDPAQEAIASFHLGWTDLLARHDPEAEACFRRAADIYRATGGRRMASLCEAARASSLGRLGRLDEARTSLARAEEELGERARESDARLFAAHRLHLDVLVAREKLENGDAVGAKDLVDAVRATGASWTEHAPFEDGRRTHEPDELRFALRVLHRELEALPSRTVAIDPDGAFFQVQGEERVELDKRAALRRILAALARLHGERPGDVLALEDIVALGWPGETIAPLAAQNRAKVALTTLRNLGLRDVLETHAGGYRLAPSLAVLPWIARPPAEP